MLDFKNLILPWYYQNFRDLPWRQNKNPYSIWLSEIILQQTQVVQGLPYYQQFIKQYPSVVDLANAPEEEVLKLWQGLGYYSRARNLHAAAKFVVQELDAIFPKTYKDLLQLKGVGDYTAAAIASIAYNQVVPTIDGNVYRVISRVFDIEVPIDSNEGKTIIKNLMVDLMDNNKPGDFNQAVMELGAMVCKPKNPDCHLCPLQEKCLALSQKTILERPIKSKKLKITDWYIDYLLLNDVNGIVLLKRDDSSIWKNLFELPNAMNNQAFKTLTHLQAIQKQFTSEHSPIVFVKEVKHKLTHKNLHIRFFKCKVKGHAFSNIVLYSEIGGKPVPKPIENFLFEFFKS